MQGLEICLISPAEVLFQVLLVLELEEGITLIFVQVLQLTGLTGHSNRSDRLSGLSAILCVRLV